MRLTTWYREVKALDQHRFNRSQATKLHLVKALRPTVVHLLSPGMWSGSCKAVISTTTSALYYIEQHKNGTALSGLYTFLNKH